jgi:lipoprotein-anchoring transpeptidase ErfK/SrfK
VPVSHGCINMANADLLELFELVPVGTAVEIVA